MVPAMYVDLAPDRQSCIWTPSMWLTLSHVVSMEVTLMMMVVVMENRMKFTFGYEPLPGNNTSDTDNDDKGDFMTNHP